MVFIVPVSAGPGVLALKPDQLREMIVVETRAWVAIEE